jgi:uncharacterized protein with PIN domain
MKLLCDESVIVAYATALADDHDVRRSVDELGEGVPDAELDEFAHRTDRVLLTRDTSALARDGGCGVVAFDVQSGATADELVAAVDDIEAAYEDAAEVCEVLRAWL